MSLDLPPNDFSYKFKRVSNLLIGPRTAFGRILKSFILMSKFERVFSTVLLMVIFVLFGLKFKAEYIAKTKVIPVNGGIYREIGAGDIKYLSPILAASDNDRSISRLIFSPLVRFDENNNPAPSIAKTWEISPDGLNYSLILRDDVYFHDGAKLTSADVLYTIEKIQSNPENALYSSWKEVKTNAENSEKITFTLPKAFGPFIYAFELGILPSNIDDIEFAKKMVGTGPYKFSEIKSQKDNSSKLVLVRNEKYFGDKAYIDQFEFIYYQKEDDAKKALSISKEKKETAVNGVFGFNPGEGFSDHSFTVSRQLGLVFNLKDSVLKDKSVREKILKNEKFEQPLSITLTTLDAPLQKSKAESIKTDLKNQNIDLTIKYFDSLKIIAAIQNKDYQCLLYGFNFGRDRDPYAFWHSSQLDKNNLAGYSDKKSDILLEDARMILDVNQRNTKYAEFDQIIQGESAIEFYEPIQVAYFLKKDELHAGESVGAKVPESRFCDVCSWYLKEGRAKK